MTVIARRIISEPVRSASETWQVVVDLLTPEESVARNELLAVTGIVSSLIAEEIIKDSPIVVIGEGPRIRIYGLYGEDAIIGEDANESKLEKSPLSGNWTISLPCVDSDIAWINSALKKKSTHIVTRDMKLPLDEVKTNEETKSASVDIDAFLKL